MSTEDETVAGKRRKNYRITNRGRKLTVEAQAKLRKLFSELVDDRNRMAKAKKPGSCSAQS